MGSGLWARQSLVADVTPLDTYESERLGMVPPERLTPDQAHAVEAFRAERGADLFGPFIPLLWSPEALLRTAALGDYLRYRSALPPRLSELVILIVARHWSQPYEWAYHCPIALQAGVSRAVVDAINDGRRPDRMAADEETIYDFCTELLETKRVTDATYARARNVFGEPGVVDMIGLAGYYSLIAMILNTARTPPDATEGPALKDLEALGSNDQRPKTKDQRPKTS